MNAPLAKHLLALETPFGRPVRWADVALVTDIGDSHDLNDDRCLVLTSTELGQRASGSSDFMLCLLADGATGSTFGPRISAEHRGESPKQAGWRASQLAQGAFVESFMASAEVDILERLKDGLAAADRALLASDEGTLSTTLVALYIAADGTAYAASIGDSVLLVLPPRRKTPGDRRLKKLGYEDSTSVGSGDTTLSTIDENDCIEQWWPHKEDGGATTRVAPGTVMVLMSDGLSDNLPADFIDQLVHRYPVDRATVGLPLHTRDRRLETQKRSGGSTQQLGLDNMSAIVVRFDGRRRALPAATLAHRDDASLLTVMGTHGGPAPDAGGQFGLVCVADRKADLVPAFLRQFIESEHHGEVDDRLAAAFRQASAQPEEGAESRFAVLAVDEMGTHHTFTAGGGSIGPGSDLQVRIAARVVAAARETRLQRLIHTPSIWGPAIAALAVFVLVSTAFATGTVRPAPPPAPPPRPGELRPTPDTRPSLSLGGFVLQPPLQPTAVPSSPPSSPAPASGDAPQVDGPDPSADDSAEPGMPAEPSCTNLLGIGCQAPPPPPVAPAVPVRRAPAPAPLNRVVPVPSPAALIDGAADDLYVASSAPPRGSRLETALQGASAADENFAREVNPASP